jgi:hypothetical protein
LLAGQRDVSVPSCDVASESIDTGPRARCFAQYMNAHALEATGGYVYSEMGIYAAAADAPKLQVLRGGGTNNPKYAQIDPTTKQPVQNTARNIWVSETALSTALNVRFIATAVSLFGLVVGVALLLAGIGFIVIALRAMPRARAAEAGWT